MQVGPQNWKRDWVVRVDGQELGTSRAQAALDPKAKAGKLDIEFEIEKSLDREPNKCTLRVLNLAEGTRKELSSKNLYDPKKQKGLARGNVAKQTAAPKTGKIRVEIEAGYEGHRGLIFLGDLRRALSSQEQDGTWVTTIAGEDGGRTYLQSHVADSWPPGTPKLLVVTQLAASLGLGVGNIAEVSAKLSGLSFPNGTYLKGPAAEVLHGVLKGTGIVYSIQNGVLQFRYTNPDDIDPRALLNAHLISTETGLVGTPEHDAHGFMTFRCLLNPTLAPGAFCVLNSSTARGTFIAHKVTYTGSTFTNDWYCEVEAKPAKL